MSYRTDLAAIDSAGKVVLAVEVKSKQGTDKAWAASVYETFYKREMADRTAYFLLAMPDMLYFWHHRRRTRTSKPSYILKTRNLFDANRLAMLEKADHQVLQMIFSIGLIICVISAKTRRRKHS
jgi:hypothetical protein